MYHVGQWIVRHKVGAVAVLSLAVVIMAPNHGGTGLFAAATPPAPMPQPVATATAAPQVVELPVDAPDSFYDDAGGDELGDDLAAQDPAMDVEPDLVPEPEPAGPDLVAEPGQP